MPSERKTAIDSRDFPQGVSRRAVHEYTLKDLAAYGGLHDAILRVIAKRVDGEDGHQG